MRNAGNDYSFQIPQGSELVGFFGRSGIYVDTLGAIHRELWH
ncbi:jacalin-like lectin [uncultured Nostoc sp.]